MMRLGRAALAGAVVLAGVAVMPMAAHGATTGSISGTIRAGGAPYPGAFATVIAIEDNGAFGRGPVPIAGAEADANGHYTISDLPPSGSNPYWVCFDPGFFGTYDGQCWDQADGYFPFPSGAGFLQASPGSARISLAAGQNRTGIDADLHQSLSYGGSISGYVRQFGLLPLHTVRVDALQNGASSSATYTATNGRYLITGLPAGSYQVCFDGSQATGGTSSTKHYGSTCRAALVTVRTGVTTTGVNATLNAKLT